ncbi:hypothetical protein Tco_0836917 [Tanacetum coccineum]
MKGVARTSVLMDSVAGINDPQYDLLLLRACAERIITVSAPDFCDWQWRLSTLPFAFGGLGVYSVASRSTFDDAFCVFNTKMEIDILSNPSVPLFSFLKPCSACSRVFTGDIYGDHAVSCAGIIGIKHWHNIVHDTLVDICFMSGVSAGLDVCVDLKGSSPLTQTGMVDFVAGRAVTDAAHRKRSKYETKCSDIGYNFLPFSFSSLGELDNDAVALLKRNRKFSMTQDIRARVVAHIFNRISFVIANGVGTQIVF